MYGRNQRVNFPFSLSIFFMYPINLHENWGRQFLRRDEDIPDSQRCLVSMCLETTVMWKQRTHEAPQIPSMALPQTFCSWLQTRYHRRASHRDASFARLTPKSGGALS